MEEAAPPTGGSQGREEEGQEGRKMKFVTRTNNGVELYWANPDVVKDEGFSCPTGQHLQFSNDGKYVGIVTPDEILVYNSDTGESVTKIQEANVVHAGFSPQNLFLLTWKRWSKEQQASSVGNVSVWSLKSGERLYHFIQKKPQRQALQWTDDELLSAKLVNSEIQFFVGQRWDQVVKTIKVTGVEDFAFAPGVSPPTIAVFAPEKKGGPGFVRIYKYPKVGEPIASRALFKAQEVEFLWNSKATAVLVMTHTSVDRTGKSYYGETGLQYLSTDTSLDCNVSLDKDGPVHDAKWSPDGSQFVVIYGYMPAQASLFDEKCRKLADFGCAPRNTIQWSPCGRLLALAGFGNLKGDVDVWDVKRVRKVGSFIADCGCSLEWSPDAQLLMTAALSPKIRVDNGYTIWRYDGSVYHHSPFPVLYEVKWQPQPFSSFPLRRIKLPPQGKVASQSPTAPAKPAIYQPPSRRGQAPPPPSREDTEAQKPRKYRNNNDPRSTQSSLPIGAALESKTALRNKQRRQRRKQKGQGEDQPSPRDEKESNDGDEHASNVSQQTDEAKQAGDPSKQARAIQKKLRQISQLKEKQAAGQPLDKSQLAKIATAGELEHELSRLSKLVTQQN